MLDDKPWYQSKTVWGGLVALGAAIAGLGGLHVAPATQDAVATALLDTAAAKTLR